MYWYYWYYDTIR